MLGDSSQLANHPNRSMFDKQLQKLRSWVFFGTFKGPSIIGDTIFTVGKKQQWATPCLHMFFPLARRNWKARNGGFAGTPPRLSEAHFRSINQSINQSTNPSPFLLCTLSVKPVPGHTPCRFSPDISTPAFGLCIDMGNEPLP